MASLQSIEKKRESLKKLLIDEVKPWLDANLNTDYLNIGVEAQMTFLKFTHRVFLELASYSCVYQLPVDTTDHGLNTRVFEFVKKSIDSLARSSMSFNQISEAGKRDDNSTYDKDGFNEQVYAFAIADGCSLAYAQIYGLYRLLKENKELCDHIFDQDRDFWKKL